MRTRGATAPRREKLTAGFPARRPARASAAPRSTRNARRPDRAADAAPRPAPARRRFGLGRLRRLDRLCVLGFVSAGLRFRRLDVGRPRLALAARTRFGRTRRLAPAFARLAVVIRNLGRARRKHDQSIDRLGRAVLIANTPLRMRCGDGTAPDGRVSRPVSACVRSSPGSGLSGLSPGDRAHRRRRPAIEPARGQKAGERVGLIGAGRVVLPQERAELAGAAALRKTLRALMTDRARAREHLLRGLALVEIHRLGLRHRRGRLVTRRRRRRPLRAVARRGLGGRGTRRPQPEYRRQNAMSESAATTSCLPYSGEFGVFDRSYLAHNRKNVAHFRVTGRFAG